MSTRLHDICDTLLWLGAGLAALVLAPLFVLVRAALPEPASAHPAAGSSAIRARDDDARYASCTGGTTFPMPERQ